MNPRILGIHHVTAIAGDPQRNLDFYTGTLGLRLVKVTINYDDPGAYHFYYGDGAGTPGTILTFFPWPHSPQGRAGTGQPGVTSFAIPQSSLAWWMSRFDDAKVAYRTEAERFGDRAISFADPDGLNLELIASPAPDPRTGWDGGPVPPEHAIRGFHSLSLWENSPDATALLLNDGMGFERIGVEGNRTRFAVDNAALGAIVDVLAMPNERRGFNAVGTVHHVAWRSPDDADQLRWLERLSARGLAVSPVMDRQYFHSIYYREPGGVLFEIATDPPGFTADEPPAALGTSLQLPKWLEPRRESIRAALPKVRNGEVVLP